MNRRVTELSTSAWVRASRKRMETNQIDKVCINCLKENYAEYLAMLS